MEVRSEKAIGDVLVEFGFRPEVKGAGGASKKKEAGGSKKGGGGNKKKGGGAGKKKEMNSGTSASKAANFRKVWKLS